MAEKGSRGLRTAGSERGRYLKPAAYLSSILRRRSAGLAPVLGIQLIPKSETVWFTFPATDAPIFDSWRDVARNNASQRAYSVDINESLVVGDDRDATPGVDALFPEHSIAT